MKHLKILTYSLIIAALLGVAVLFSASSVQAQATGDTEVRVVVPPVLILYYYSVLIVELDPAAINAYQSSDEGSQTVTLGGWTGDAGITPAAGAPTLTDGQVVINNAWGYWAVGGSRNMQVEISEGSDLTLENGSASLDLSNFEIQAGATWGTTVPFTGPAGSGTGTGAIRFAVNLANAGEAGTYQNTPAATTFTISLTYL